MKFLKNNYLWIRFFNTLGFKISIISFVISLLLCFLIILLTNLKVENYYTVISPMSLIPISSILYYFKIIDKSDSKMKINIREFNENFIEDSLNIETNYEKSIYILLENDNSNEKNINIIQYYDDFSLNVIYEEYECFEFKNTSDKSILLLFFNQKIKWLKKSKKGFVKKINPDKKIFLIFKKEISLKIKWFNIEKYSRTEIYEKN